MQYLGRSAQLRQQRWESEVHRVVAETEIVTDEHHQQTAAINKNICILNIKNNIMPDLLLI